MKKGDAKVLHVQTAQFPWKPHVFTHWPKVDHKAWLPNEAPGYVKLLRINPGGEIASHTHEDYADVFFFLDGSLHLETDGQTFTCNPQDYAIVPPQTPHRLCNAGENPGTFLLFRAY